MKQPGTRKAPCGQDKPLSAHHPLQEAILWVNADLGITRANSAAKRLLATTHSGKLQGTSLAAALGASIPRNLWIQATQSPVLWSPNPEAGSVYQLAVYRLDPKDSASPAWQVSLVDVSAVAADGHLLRQQVEGYRRLLDCAAEGIWVVDASDITTYVNPKMAEMLGSSPQQMIGQPLSQYMGNDPITEDLNSNTPGGPYRDFKFKRSDGREFWTLINTNPLLDSDGNYTGALGLLTDITERKRVEQTLQLQTRAMNAAGDQIIIADSRGRILFANQAFQDESGYTTDEARALESGFAQPGVHPPEFYREMWDTILDGQTWKGEVTNRRKDGSLYVEEMTITPVMTEDGQIQNFIAIKRNATQRKIQEQKLKHLASHDALTGLPNRTLFAKRLQEKMEEARSRDGYIAVVFLDLDKFKYINDTLGHECGDYLLQLVAKRLTDAVRDGDTVARMGGDEFTILLGRINHPSNAQKVAERVMSRMAQPFLIAGREVPITASLGISLYPQHGQSAEDLLRLADSAMFQAKQSGRNKYAFWQPKAA